MCRAKARACRDRAGKARRLGGIGKLVRNASNLEQKYAQHSDMVITVPS
jgi:hypothetical protein